MRTETKEIIIPAAAQGVRVDSFLKETFPQFSRHEWQKRLDEGTIYLNGRASKASRRLNAGDHINFSYQMPDEPEVPREIPILYEDENYLVVNKPPGLPVHPSGIYKTQTLINFLAEQKILEHGHLLHRLDRETSGVLALAKNRVAAIKFQQEQRAGRIEKYYQVIIEGQLREPLDARGFIYQRPNQTLSRRRFYSTDEPTDIAIEIQSCRTLFTPISKHGELCLIQARLYTGRMHQIRATLFACGYPVVGDKLYGRDENLYFRFADDMMTPQDWSLLRMNRCALHAGRLILQHPIQKTTWQIDAPLPRDMQDLLGPV